MTATTTTLQAKKFALKKHQKIDYREHVCIQNKHIRFMLMLSPSFMGRSFDDDDDDEKTTRKKFSIININ